MTYFDLQINSNCVVVFAKAGCGPCQVVRRMLNQADIPFKLIDVEQCPQLNAKDLLQKTGCKTVSLLMYIFSYSNTVTCSDRINIIYWDTTE